MNGVAGYRKVRVFRETTDAIVDMHGNFLYVEVTNNGSSEVDFMPNDFPEQGNVGVGIPIAPGTTRVIPMAVYKFTATGPVTVVAYGA